MKPLHDHPAGQVPAKEFLRLAHQFIAPSLRRKLEPPANQAVEVVTGGPSKLPGTGKDSTAPKPAMKPTTTKAPATTKPKPIATKPDAKRPTTTNAAAGGSKPSTKPTPRPIQKKKPTYVDIRSSDEESSAGMEDGEEDDDDDEESEEEEEEEEEEEVVVVKPTRRRVVKSSAVITEEMEEVAPGGEAIKWSVADRKQAAEDAKWIGPDPKDPCLVEGKDLRYGPLYWGPYDTPLAKEGPIAKEDLPDRSLNPLDKDGHAKYILADVYDTPCRQCTAAKTTPKVCVTAGSRPNALGATVKEEKEKASSCACCRVHKRRCEDHSRSRSRQIIANPFHDPNTVKKGASGKAKVKTEAVTPAAKTRGSKKAAAEKEVVNGESRVHMVMDVLTPKIRS